MLITIIVCSNYMRPEPSLISKKQWIYTSMCGVSGLLILLNFGQYVTLSNYVMIPVDIIGGLGFFLFLRSFEKEQEIKN